MLRFASASAGFTAGVRRRRSRHLLGLRPAGMPEV